MSRGLAKRNGDALEADQIAQEAALVGVSDDEATWHDARTVLALEPRQDLPFGSICVVDVETPVEVKTCQLTISNGSSGEIAGCWYVKQRAHQRLLEAGGVYLLVVYANGEASDPDDLEIVRRLVLPASVLDGYIPSWSDPGDDREERAVGRVRWTALFNRDDLLGDNSSCPGGAVEHNPGCGDASGEDAGEDAARSGGVA